MPGRLLTLTEARRLITPSNDALLEQLDNLYAIRTAQSDVPPAQSTTDVLDRILSRCSDERLRSFRARHDLAEAGYRSSVRLKVAVDVREASNG